MELEERFISRFNHYNNNFMHILYREVKSKRKEGYIELANELAAWLNLSIKIVVLCSNNYLFYKETELAILIHGDPENEKHFDKILE